LVGRQHLLAFYFRNDCLGIELWSRDVVDGNYMPLPLDEHLSLGTVETS
jgi:hypothetical protein